jgi:hypothetical protein
MSAREEFAAILQQWLQLTREEGAAIQSADWPAVRLIQTRKASLRGSFTAAAHRCAGDDKSSAPVQPASKSFRAEAARILSLLTRNSAALAAQMHQVRTRQEALDQTKRILSKIQRSYFRPRQPRAWNYYS